MKKNIAILVLVAAAIALVIVYTGDRKPSSSVANGTESGNGGVESGEASKPKPGERAPAFKLAALEDGKRLYEVGGKRDKVLIVNFWASWCGPCEDEAPDLQALYEEYGGKVDLYGVNATKYDVARNAKLFVKEYGFTFPVLTDADGAVGDAYKVFSYPMSFVVDREGVIRERIEGGKSIAEWRKILDPIIAG